MVVGSTLSLCKMAANPRANNLDADDVQIKVCTDLVLSPSARLTE